MIGRHRFATFTVNQRNLPIRGRCSITVPCSAHYSPSFFTTNLQRSFRCMSTDDGFLVTTRQSESDAFDRFPPSPRILTTDTGNADLDVLNRLAQQGNVYPVAYSFPYVATGFKYCGPYPPSCNPTGLKWGLWYLALQ